MEQGVDYTIEPFKYRKHGPRSDKGRTHNSKTEKEMAITQLSKINLLNP